MKKGLVHEFPVNKTVEWYTPPHVFKKLDLVFDLDPCSPAGGLPWIPAKMHYALPQDGLVLPWAGLVWMNPPYGSATQYWMKKFIEHRNGIALVFARTDTEWFHNYALKADALCFTKGRIKFVQQNLEIGGTPGAGSLYVACGEVAVTALQKANLGWFLRL